MKKFILALLAISSSYAEYNSVRAIFWVGNVEIPPSFLTRARANGYNYVIGTFAIPCDPTIGNGSLEARLGVLKWQVTESLSRTNAAGLKFIPTIQTGSRWAANWDCADSTIDLNAGVVDTVTKNHRSFVMAGTPYSPKDTAMDNAFRTVLNTIQAAFEDASLPLEYIHLGHDEAYASYHPPEEEIYGPASWSDELEYGVPRLLPGYGPISWSSLDRDYIDSLVALPNSIELAFQKIYVQEILSRVSAVSDVIGSDTKVLIWADMWDPQANGRLYSSTYLHDDTTLPNLPNIRLAPENSINSGIATLPGLDSSQRALLKSKLILMPWAYSSVWGSEPYDASSTLEYFTHNGFKVIWQSAVTDWNNNPITTQTTLQIRGYAAAAYRRKDYVLGYCASPFISENPDDVYANPTYNVWKSIEYIRNAVRPNVSLRSVTLQ